MAFLSWLEPFLGIFGALLSGILGFIGMFLT